MLPAPGNRIAPQDRLPTPGSLKGQLTDSWFHCGGPQVQPIVVTAGLTLCGHRRVSNSYSDLGNKQAAMPRGEMQCGLEDQCLGSLLRLMSLSFQSGRFLAVWS